MLTEYKKIKYDDEAENIGCKIKDYKQYKKSRFWNAISIFSIAIIYLLIGSFLSFVIEAENDSEQEENTIEIGNALVLAREICESNNYGRHIRTQFGTNRSIIECENGNLFLNQ